MNRLPVPNLTSAIVNKFGKVIPPWNSWFQQFSQDAPAVVGVVLGASPFSYTANSNGTIFIFGGTVSLITLRRGITAIAIATSTVNTVSVPISIGDTIEITYTVLPTLQFWGA